MAMGIGVTTANALIEVSLASSNIKNATIPWVMYSGRLRSHPLRFGTRGWR
jgi:hypothetical protein